MHLQEDQLQAIIAAILEAGSFAAPEGYVLTPKAAARQASDILAAVHENRMQSKYQKG